jgi:hypothetical protein
LKTSFPREGTLNILAGQNNIGVQIIAETPDSAFQYHTIPSAPKRTLPLEDTPNHPALDQ